MDSGLDRGNVSMLVDWENCEMTEPALARCGCGGEAEICALYGATFARCRRCNISTEPQFEGNWEGTPRERATALWNVAMTRDCLHCEKLEAKIRDPYMEGREDAFEAIVADLRRLGAKYLEQGKPELYAVCDYASRTYDRGKLMTTETEPKGERDVDSRTN
jgi:hypothetical protein